MTRFIHDQFAKQYLTELLTPYGQVETSKDITAEVRQIDVLSSEIELITQCHCVSVAWR
ncbi:hypothetical protein IQ228_18085 [Dolichospermum sp. LEGE 00246]|jgi:hypothetical protein|nr:hypothetical protein [Dolichospermum sp. LEGE 00246]MBE9259195.1 hypothetical protein [Dolichospermum sp. LEGE 00246]